MSWIRCRGDIMTSWQHDIRMIWHHDIMTTWDHDIMTSWQQCPRLGEGVSKHWTHFQLQSIWNYCNGKNCKKCKHFWFLGIWKLTLTRKYVSKNLFFLIHSMPQMYGFGAHVCITVSLGQGFGSITSTQLQRHRATSNNPTKCKEQSINISKAAQTRHK